ncbi:hypothetical protein CJF42_16145 [Pseudoalteromonas sp. NBT06-2]|uniref:hypothetical protein n=1 Tax=Pseudoalteromonas sp. NBT06-2 TaxID=2025950 RepID=UPI000BA7446A|nr:hypothetical protein [Pseudoalteromonas sp. NBT06-2]PAJ73366.1 hypothetical protein CJF42_16145 [Pseudoalteromonas sp. NBT06-2]
MKLISLKENSIYFDKNFVCSSGIAAIRQWDQKARPDPKFIHLKNLMFHDFKKVKSMFKEVLKCDFGDI